MDRNKNKKHLIVLLLMAVFCCGNVYAQHKQTVTVQVENANLKQVFAAIESQTTYHFSYRDEIIDKRQDITLNMTKAPVERVLNRALMKRNLAYRVVSEKSIVIYDKDSEPDVTGQKHASKRKITGRVIDSSGEPIIGASVMPNVAGGQPIPAVASVSAPASASAPVSASAPASAPMSAMATAPTPAPAVTPETAQAMEEATTTYVDRLNELNELLLKVGAQTERITTDSEEMENLNRTLTGIARIYEMQLKSASQQINTQDEINEQTRKMAAQIAELNSIYARMIDAMKAGQNS